MRGKVGNQMRLSVHMLLVAFVGLSVLYSPSVAADVKRPPEHLRSENVPLSQSDLRDITAQVMAKQPLLSSSPGIKAADASRVWGEDIANVIWHPHSEEAGIKQAFQVQCDRKPPNETWNCEHVSIRRYLALGTQDYEVRVTGPISFDGAMALIEASRQVLPLVADDGVPVPDTVRDISSFDGGANVVWVNFEGGSSILIAGQLTQGGDPAQPDNWILNRVDLALLGLE